MIKFVKLAAIGLAVAVAGPVTAAPMLDASYAGSGTPQYTFAVNGSSPILAETFTAETSGRLTGYSIYAVPILTGTTAPLTVSLTTTVAAGSPAGGTILTARQLSTAAVTAQGFFDFDVSSDDVNVTAGRTYALVVATAAPTPSAGIGGDSPGTYGAGATYFGRPDNLQLAPRTDLLFRTFVDATPTLTAPPSDVPEPATAALLGAGLFGLGLLRRRQA